MNVNKNANEDKRSEFGVNIINIIAFFQKYLIHATLKIFVPPKVEFLFPFVVERY